MKKSLKIVFLMFIIIFMQIFSSQVYATRSIFDQAKSFLQEGTKGTGMLSEGTKAYEKTKDMISKITGVANETKSGFEEVIDILWSFGLLTIFISTVILGIKYMLVLPEERSRIKQATTPYVIGVIIIFGALTIWKLVIVVLDGSLN